jgi:hypothetical protein
VSERPNGKEQVSVLDREDQVRKNVGQGLGAHLYNNGLMLIWRQHQTNRCCRALSALTLALFPDLGLPGRAAFGAAKDKLMSTGLATDRTF